MGWIPGSTGQGMWSKARVDVMLELITGNQGLVLWRLLRPLGFRDHELAGYVADPDIFKRWICSSSCTDKHDGAASWEGLQMLLLAGE